MNDDAAALLAAIDANPGEITPHLLYADYLAETDERDGCMYRIVHDHANDEWRLQYARLVEAEDPARATLIRVQCRVESNRSRCCDAEAFVYNKYGGRTSCSKCCGTGDRDRELIELNRERWLRIPCPLCLGVGIVGERADSTFAKGSCPHCNGTGDIGGLTARCSYCEGMGTGFSSASQCVVCSGTGYCHPAVFRRGFPDEVQGCWLEDVFTTISAQGVAVPDKWVPTAWATRVITHHPTIRRMKLVEQFTMLPVDVQVMLMNKIGENQEDWVGSSVVTVIRTHINKEKP